MDITQLILDDHHEQRRLFTVIEQIASSETEALRLVWGRLSAFLEVHAEAEEQFFYPDLLKKGQGAADADTAAEATEDAIADHNEIRQAIADVPDDDIGSDGWFEAVAAVNIANGDHMAEEERQGLTDFRRSVGLQERHDLAVRFATFEAANVAGVKPVDKDPEEYIAAHE